VSVFVRDATDADLPAVQRIYAHEVRHGVATFEESPPSVAELRSRRDAIVREGLPFLVAELTGEVVGYSYASGYRPRSAYRYTIEDSVYVAERHQRQGVGYGLLAALIERCERGPWRQLVAVIGDSGNPGSIALHERHGFRWAGTLTAVGFKLGQWIDTVLMQRPLGPGNDRLP
jgi:L-amino acid N-acyltransferase YncA